MTKKFFFLLTACFILYFFSSFAFAFDGFYISGNGGVVWLLDSDIDNDVTGKAEFDTGYGFGGALGYGLDQWRLEFEVEYRNNDYDKVSASEFKAENVSGSFESLGFMMNLYYDFETKSPFSPFLMGGVGGARLETDTVSGGGITIISDDDWEFAYQLGTGVGWKATDTLLFDLSYRFFATTKPEFNDVEMEYFTHNILIGLRFLFK